MGRFPRHARFPHARFPQPARCPLSSRRCRVAGDRRVVARRRRSRARVGRAAAISAAVALRAGQARQGRRSAAAPRPASSARRPPAATAPARPIRGRAGPAARPSCLARTARAVVRRGAGLRAAALPAAAGRPAGGRRGGCACAPPTRRRLLALTIGLVSVAVGLYSADLYLQTRRLLTGTALGGCLALPAVWRSAGRAVGIDLGGLAGGHALLPLAALAGWTLLPFAPAAGVQPGRARQPVRPPRAGGRRRPGRSPPPRAWSRPCGAAAGSFQVAAVLPAREAGRLTPGLLRQRKVWGIVLTDAARRTLAARAAARAGVPPVRRGRVLGKPVCAGSTSTAPARHAIPAAATRATATRAAARGGWTRRSTAPATSLLAWRCCCSPCR